MPSRPAPTRLAPYARLPRTYRDLHIVHSTVDAYGRAHWLLCRHRLDRGRTDPWDALVVTVEDGSSYETHLSAVLARCRQLEALPDGGFVLAAFRSGKDEDHVQVFDALGRSTWTFHLGDGIEALLADEAGDLWVGYFDEGTCGSDELSWPGLRRWSSAGEPLWQYGRGPGLEPIFDCYALNVDTRATWACPYRHFPLLEIRDSLVVGARANPVAGAHGLAVHADRVVFFSPYGDDGSRIVDCRLTKNTVEPVAEGRLVRPDGGELGRRRVVCRGPRLYVQEESFTEWTLLDIA